MSWSEDPVAAFTANLDDWTLLAECGRLYVRTPTLVEWLREPADASEPQTSRADKLHEIAHEAQALRTFRPFLSFAEDGRELFLVFSVLMSIKKGHLIDKFSDRNLFDTKLPIKLDDLQFLKPHGDNISREFYSRQFRFCPAKFVPRGWENDDADYVPICRRRAITKGGTASLWQISIQAEFVDARLKELASSTVYPDKDFGTCYYFALKTFTHDKKDVFIKECNAFKGLRNQKAMVRCFGYYTLRAKHDAGDEDRSHGHEYTEHDTSYNLLLEFGEIDLDNLFRTNLPPILPSEIIQFWTDLFEVCDAVNTLQNLRLEGKMWHGWHADIKPSNILLVGGKFKLADFGFAHFELQSHENNFPLAEISHGTDTFGAPELCYSREEPLERVSQRIDTFSLGTVFSLAATYVITGWKGIRTFDLVRERAIDKIQKSQLDSNARSGHEKYVIPSGDRFHDGYSILEDVTAWHQGIRPLVRICDPVTLNVLDFVDNKMLLADPSKRIAVSDLCEQLKSILPPPQPVNLIQKNICEAMRIIERTAEPDTMSDDIQTSAIPQTSLLAAGDSHDYDWRSPNHNGGSRSTRQVQRRRAPVMRTTHRWEALQKVSENTQTTHDDLPEFPGTQFRPPSVPGPPLPLSREPTYGKDESWPAQYSSSSNESTVPFLSVHESHLKSKRKRSWLPWKKLTGTEKNQELIDNFQGRDIKFLVDNGMNMQPYWAAAENLIDTLVRECYGVDEDGMDLSFTSSREVVLNSNDPKLFRKAMERVGNHLDHYTNINIPLGAIFQQWLDRHKQFPPKKLTLIILTTGVWEGVMNKEAVYEKVQNIATDSAEKSKHVERPFSIEFIYFGNDPEAISFLKRLDDEIKPDIVDIEPGIGGNVNKMLQGSFLEKYDYTESNSTSGPSSPTPTIQGLVYQNLSPQDQEQSSQSTYDHGPDPLPSNYSASNSSLAFQPRVLSRQGTDQTRSTLTQPKYVKRISHYLRSR